MSSPADAARTLGAAWPAPVAGGPIDARVRVPGSKSLTNRYFALAALACGPTVVREPLIARDTILMARALQAMGVSVALGERETVFEPGPLHGGRVDVGLAGTVMRFVPALAMLASGEVRIDGDAGARVRPMGPVVRAIESLGVRVRAARNGAGEPCLPIAVHGTGAVRGGVVEIDASASSQFLSALMLAAPAIEGGLDIRHTGSRVPSGPHLQMTVDVLRKAGVRVETLSNSPEPDSPVTRWIVHEGSVHLGDVRVEPDLSNAGPFLAAAMVTGGEVTIENWPESTTQPGASFAELFEAMGGRIGYRAETGELTCRGPLEISGIDVDMHDVGELVPTVAAVAAFARSPSALRNIGQLRGHETDRLAALVTELNAIGCPARIEGDDLLVSPPSGAPGIAGGPGARGGLHRARLRTYADHRMATFAAIIGLALDGVEVENIETTAKTFPQFARMWSQMAAGAPAVEPESVDIGATEAQA